MSGWRGPDDLEETTIRFAKWVELQFHLACVISIPVESGVRKNSAPNARGRILEVTGTPALFEDIANCPFFGEKKSRQSLPGLGVLFTIVDDQLSMTVVGSPTID
jgi:hypothetical protein